MRVFISGTRGYIGATVALLDDLLSAEGYDPNPPIASPCSPTPRARAGQRHADPAAGAHTDALCVSAPRDAIAAHSVARLKKAAPTPTITP